MCWGRARGQCGQASARRREGEELTRGRRVVSSQAAAGCWWCRGCGRREELAWESGRAVRSRRRVWAEGGGISMRARLVLVLSGRHGLCKLDFAQTAAEQRGLHRTSDSTAHPRQASGRLAAARQSVARQCQRLAAKARPAMRRPLRRQSITGLRRRVGACTLMPVGIAKHIASHPVQSHQSGKSLAQSDSPRPPTQPSAQPFLSASPSPPLHVRRMHRAVLCCSPKCCCLHYGTRPLRA